jgi:hypothetical protein
MKTFAVIENGIVLNAIVADSKAIAEEATGKTCVEYTDSNPAYIGLGYDGTTFEQPAPVEVSTEEVEIS